MNVKKHRAKTKLRQGGHRYWPHRWDCIEMPTTDAAAAELVADCPTRLKTMLDLARTEVDAGRRSNAARINRLILRSDSAKVAAMTCAVRHRTKSLRRSLHPGDLAWRPMKQAGIATVIVSDALKLNMWRGTGERTYWAFELQTNGKARLRYESGLMEYARQYLALCVSRTMAVISPRQFILRGGVPAMVEWLNANIPSAKVVATTDIPACFYALYRDRVEADTPLPGPVLRSVLFDPMDQAKRRPLSYGCDDTSLTPSLYGCGAGSGRGIPIGSAFASLAAEVSLRHILEAVENAVEGVRVAIYGDNIIILASSSEVVTAAIDALCEAASERITPTAVEGLRTRIKISTPTEGFSFIGSDFRLRKKGVLERRRPAAYFENFENRLAGDIGNHEITKAEAHRWVKAWAAANEFDPRTAKIAARIIEDFDLAGSEVS